MLFSSNVAVPSLFWREHLGTKYMELYMKISNKDLSYVINIHRVKLFVSHELFVTYKRFRCHSLLAKSELMYLKVL